LSQPRSRRAVTSCLSGSTGATTRGQLAGVIAAALLERSGAPALTLAVRGRYTGAVPSSCSEPLRARSASAHSECAS
jgi:hypothetical protein